MHCYSCIGLDGEQNAVRYIHNHVEWQFIMLMKATCNNVQITTPGNGAHTVTCLYVIFTQRRIYHVSSLGIPLQYNTLLYSR